MKRIYLSPSAQENNVGAGSYGTEEQRMNQLCDLVEKKLKGRYQIYRNRPEMSLQQIVADSNAKKPDIHLALLRMLDLRQRRPSRKTGPADLSADYRNFPICWARRQSEQNPL